MPKKHIEINEVGEYQAAVLPCNRLSELRHSIGIVLCSDVVPYSAPVVNIVDFSNAKDGHVSFGKDVEQHRAGRLDCVIVAALGSAEISWRAGKWPSNHAAHAIWPVQQFPRDLANPIKLRNRNYVFVRGNLENAVARSVNNRKTHAHMLFAKLFDNFRA